MHCGGGEREGEGGGSEGYNENVSPPWGILSITVLNTNTLYFVLPKFKPNPASALERNVRSRAQPASQGLANARKK
ncbi:hypothetical protein BaRGS_00031238 [Batillaria attramentaria]|uniref:Uncharacterized protein n=1 Tax=Batillaria attramentaria TaxID=370345 RepID=A0ABD0JSK3_9CAEN